MRSTMSLRAIVILAVLIPALAYQTVVRSGLQDPKEVVAAQLLPESYDNWTSEAIDLTDAEKSMLKTPSVCQRVYTNLSTGDRVQILLLQVNNTQNAHDPRFCMTGAGYRIDSQQVLSVDWANTSKHPSQVSRTLFSQADRIVAMFYWLQTPDTTIADMSSGFKLEGIMRSLRGQSPKGIAIRLIALTKDDGTATQEQVAIDLWKSLDAQMDIQKLAREM